MRKAGTMAKSNKINGWKCFDSKLQCRGYQFEIGKIYKHIDELKMCASGFHFHHDFKDRFNYYSKSIDLRICEIEAEDFKTEGDKSVCRKIKILRELTWREINGDGYGSGDGDGYGSGDGDGYGDGSGDGSGSGYGYGSGYGDGDGYGSGSGSGSGYGDGSGSGSGSGYGDGDGYGSGYGSGEECPERAYKD